MWCRARMSWPSFKWKKRAVSASGKSARCAAQASTATASSAGAAAAKRCAAAERVRKLYPHVAAPGRLEDHEDGVGEQADSDGGDERRAERAGDEVAQDVAGADGVGALAEGRAHE